MSIETEIMKMQLNNDLVTFQAKQKLALIRVDTLVADARRLAEELWQLKNELTKNMQEMHAMETC